MWAARVGGGGSGGAIRLVAPTLSGSGTLSVNGVQQPTAQVHQGWVRLEGFQVSTTFFFPAGTIYVTRGAPIDEALLRPPAGSVRVTAIAGVPIPIYPTGSFELPDATINTNTPVNMNIEANGIPPGTVVTLRVFPQIPDDPAAVGAATSTGDARGHGGVVDGNGVGRVPVRLLARLRARHLDPVIRRRGLSTSNMPRPFRFLWCIVASAALVVCATDVSTQEPAIGSELAVPNHLLNGAEFKLTLRELIEHGKMLFAANWTDEDGVGRPFAKGTGKPLSDPSRPLNGRPALQSDLGSRRELVRRVSQRAVRHSRRRR